MKPLTPFIVGLILLFLLPGTHAWAQHDISGKADKLRSIYLAYEKAIDKKPYEIQFFQAFPRSFTEFTALYGYENQQAAPLYDQAFQHMQLFNNIQSVNDTAYYRRILSLGMDGKWDADAVSYLQQVVREHVVANIHLTVYLLRQRSLSDVSNFWYFYFDEPHPADQIDAILLKIKMLDENMYAVLKQMHGKAVVDNRH